MTDAKKPRAPRAPKPAADAVPPLAEDVAALKELLEYARANHWTLTGEVLVGRIRLGAVADVHPRTLLAQQERSAPPADDPTDLLKDFR